MVKSQDMRTSVLVVCLVALAASAPSAQTPSSGASASVFSVPVVYRNLPNGLRVVISENHAAPVVVVEVMYRIGFRIEPRNRTGFAHLFEHLMFQGSEHVGKFEHVRIVSENGGVLNGSTRFDHTNYFEMMPSNALELAMWLEADRMATLLDALSGYRRAEGRVLLNGDDFYARYALYRGLLGYVPQDDIIHLDLPVDRALRYVAQLRLPSDTSSDEIEQRIRRVLAEVEMTEHREQIVSSLSGGQRKRVSIGAELIAEPSLFFLDEATSGLDPGLEKKLMYTLRRMADAGRTIVLVTHATANIRQCDHVAFLSGGRLVFFGPPAAALDFFGAADFADIYAEIERNPELWEGRYRASTTAQQVLEARLSDLPEAPRSATDMSLPTRPLVSFLRQFFILTQRTFELVLRDSVRLAALLVVMPIIGVLLSLLADPEALVGASEERIADILQETGRYSIAAQAQSVLMMLGLAAVLLGMFVASFELVRERAIYRRERMVNLRLAPYLGSKAAVLVGFALIQCLALIVAFGIRVPFPQAGTFLPGPLEIYLTLALSAAAGTMIGLFISAIVNNAATAIYVVLFAVFAQIMFAGVIFPLPGATQALSYLTVTRWTVEALGSSIDLPGLNDLGRIEVTKTVESIDPLTNETVERPVTVRDRLHVDFNVNYGHSPSYVVERWGVLAAFSLIFGGLSVLVQRRMDS